MTGKINLFGILMACIFGLAFYQSGALSSIFLSCLIYWLVRKFYFKPSPAQPVEYTQPQTKRKVNLPPNLAMKIAQRNKGK